jgi:hypothetical protein
MEQRPSYKIINRSHSQENRSFLWEPQVLLPSSQGPAAGYNPASDESSPHLPTLFLLRFIHILSFQLCLSLPNGLFPSSFPIKILCAFLISLKRQVNKYENK